MLFTYTFHTIFSLKLPQADMVGKLYESFCDSVCCKTTIHYIVMKSYLDTLGLTNEYWMLKTGWILEILLEL